MVGAKRRRVSKNKKANWRKHSNVKDVEEYLEDVRLQERTGGLISEKTNAELFVIDKSATSQNGTPAQIRAKKKLPKQLKCHALLLPDPNIKPARIKHSVKKSDPKIEEKSQRKRKSPLKPESQKRSSGPAKKVKKPSLRVATFDLWNDGLQDKVSAKVDGIDDGHFSKVTGRRRVKPPPKFLEKPYIVSAVEVPHAGMSYNPTYEDHQDLLQDALEVEITKERAEKKIIRALDEKFPSKSEAPTEQTYLKEMSAGLKTAEEESEVDSDPEENDNDQLPVVQPVRREKKTQTQRNKEKRLKELKAKKLKQKEENLKKNEFYRLKSIKKEVAEAEAESFKRQYKRAVRQKKKVEGTHKLGFRAFEAPDIELKLSDEIEGSLRLLKPEGSLFDDRFKSLQKRNIIEPRLRAKNYRKGKYKKKTFENKEHKTVTL